MIDEFKLAELLNARFCHDLAGPLGAINNGVEFLNDSNETMKERAQGLIETSAEQAVARLQFFRQLYGSIPKDGEANIASLKELTINYFKSTKVVTNWNLEALNSGNINVANRLAKLMLNLILISAATLIRGGKVDIKIYSENKITKILLKASGEEIKFDEETENLLNGSVNIEDLSSKNIQIYYTSRLINALGAKFKIEKTTKEFKIELEGGSE